MADTDQTRAYTPRLKELYQTQYAAQLKDELGIANVNNVPKLSKVVVSSGVGRHKDDKRYQEVVMNTLTRLPVSDRSPARRRSQSLLSRFVRVWERRLVSMSPSEETGCGSFWTD